MTNTEITYQIKDIDMRVAGIVDWIKFHYSNYTPSPMDTVDYQSIELSTKMRYYHELQKQKEKLLGMYFD